MKGKCKYYKKIGGDYCCTVSAWIFGCSFEKTDMSKCVNFIQRKIKPKKH
jgi:hypothetical protein